MEVKQTSDGRDVKWMETVQLKGEDFSLIPPAIANAQGKKPRNERIHKQVN